MRSVRRSLAAQIIGAAGGTATLDFENLVQTEEGGEVVMGRQVRVFITTDTNIDVTVSYSHDFGAVFTDRGAAADVATPADPLDITYDCHGTNVRILLTNNQVGAATVDATAFLV